MLESRQLQNHNWSNLDHYHQTIDHQYELGRNPNKYEVLMNNGEFNIIGISMAIINSKYLDIIKK